jgi:tetratricopeptide (TPR) repeat protein
MVSYEKQQLELRFASSLLMLFIALGSATYVLVRYPSPRNFQNLQNTAALANIPTTPLNKTSAMGSGGDSSTAAHSANSAAKFTHATASHAQAAGTSLSDSVIDEQLTRARELVNAGRTDDAIQMLEEILRSSPDNNNALTELGMIYSLDQDNPDKAKSYLEKALQANPDNRIALSELVEIYRDEDDVQGENKLRQMVEAHPDNSRLAWGLGQVLTSSNPKEAVTYLEAAANEDPSALPDLAEAWKAAGDSEKSMETYKRYRDVEQERWRNGHYENQDEGRESYIHAQMGVIITMRERGDVEGANAELGKIKDIVNPEEFAMIKEHTVGLPIPTSKEL